MKRYIILIVLCVLTFTSAMAQGDAKKAYIPEQGDIAVSFDAAPVLKFVGNMFNGSSNNTLNNLSGQAVSANGVENFKIDDITPNVSIMGKYMVTDNIAARVNFGVNVRSLTTNAYVTDDAANITNPLNEDKLIDTRFDSKKGFSAMLGAEYRKGENRIQGIFGAGFIFGSNKVKTEYQYANAVTDLNQNPSSGFTGTAIPTTGYRTLSKTTEANRFFGLAGNVGVEWFVAPKVSLGAEVNLSIYSVKEGQTYTITEGYNSNTDCVEIRNEVSAPGNKTFVFGTDNLGGALYLSFYF